LAWAFGHLLGLPIVPLFTRSRHASASCSPGNLRLDVLAAGPSSGLPNQSAAVQTPDDESAFAGPILARPRRRARSHLQTIPRHVGGHDHVMVDRRVAHTQPAS